MGALKHRELERPKEPEPKKVEAPPPDSVVKSSRWPLVLLILIGAVFVLTVLTARWIVLASLLGIGLGVVVIPVVDILHERLRIPRVMAAGLLMLAVFGVFALISYFIVQIGSSQVVPLVDRMPEIIDSLRRRLASAISRYPTLRAQIESFNVGANLRTAVGGVANALFRGAEFGTRIAAEIVFILFLALYVSVSPKSYMAGILSLFPAYHRTRLKHLMHLSAKTLRQWFTSQALAMAAVGTLTAFGLWLIGVDYWLLFGLITGLVDLVPYVGPMIALVISSLITLGTQSEKVPWLIAIFLLIQQLEAHLIIPIIMKGRSELPPAQLVILMLLLGAWFGIIGLLLAPAFLAVARAIYLDVYVPRMDKMVVRPRD